ncbi:MAG TPA: class I SAM-dependent methyltransferase [Methylomirabilota bacterium]|nr:class I SAM-dependent methyltransferase [Methylomirabilota bacterium]
MERILEPELMVDAGQTLAYAQADFAEVNQGFVDRFVGTFPDFKAGGVIDLGCGPADIPIRLARALPAIRITAVDGSEAMLAFGHRAIEDAGLGDRIRLLHARVPNLPLPPHSFDAVISNSLLHHLPGPSVFWKEVMRLAKPGAAVLIMDLFRFDSPEEAKAYVERVAATEAPILKEDFYNSLLAAFTPEEVRAQLAKDLSGLECRVISDRHWLVSGRLP